MEGINDILSVDKVKKEHADSPNELNLSSKKHQANQQHATTTTTKEVKGKTLEMKAQKSWQILLTPANHSGV